MKRLFDIVVAGTLLLLLVPVVLAVALLVRAHLGRPVVFRQVRPGRHGTPFELVKFRTMRDILDADGQAAPDAERLTRLGRGLRAASLDELPQLWNVLKGDMSLVGPRPLLMEYLPRYTDDQRRRHDVRPGITGLAQVKGRNSLSWDDRFALDVWYVDNHSARLDAKVLALTVAGVVARNGISAENHATMETFHGTSPEGTS